MSTHHHTESSTLTIWTDADHWRAGTSDYIATRYEHTVGRCPAVRHPLHHPGINTAINTAAAWVDAAPTGTDRWVTITRGTWQVEEVAVGYDIHLETVFHVDHQYPVFEIVADDTGAVTAAGPMGVPLRIAA